MLEMPPFPAAQIEGTLTKEPLGVVEVIRLPMKMRQGNAAEIRDAAFTLQRLFRLVLLEKHLRIGESQLLIGLLDLPMFVADFHVADAENGQQQDGGQTAQGDQRGR